MPLTIPVAVNYPSPLTAIPSVMQDEPVEGRKQVSCEIDWVTMGGAANCVSFNLQNNATLNLSQISTLKVDNSACGSDVTFIFPDTGETIDIPAYSPLDVVPVFSNSLQFYVTAANPLAVDITRFQILNYAVRPASVAISQEQNTIVPVTTASLAAATTPLLGSGSGTVEALYIGATISAATAAYDFQISILDHVTVRELARCILSGPIGALFNGPLLQLTGINRRFAGGLDLNISGTVAGLTGHATASVFYRTP